MTGRCGGRAPAARATAVSASVPGVTRETLALSYPAAIPVGHRIEATWFLKPRGRRAPIPSKPAEPVVTDRDTGIRYGLHWHFGEAALFRPDRPNAYTLTPLDGLQVERVVRGRVTACTIVQISPTAEPYQHTLLELELD